MQDNVHYEKFLNALLEGDRNLCSEITRNELNKNESILGLYEHLLKTSLYKIGELWEHNKISVATEHLA